MNRPNHFIPNLSKSEIFYEQIRKLTGSYEERTDALFHISIQRESIPNLAIYLWESPGIVVALLTEIIKIYPSIITMSQNISSTTSPLDFQISSRAIHALTLFQSIADDEKTQLSFIKSNIPIYLFPFLHTTNPSRECECLKITSLGVFGCLVKSGKPQIIEYLLQNEFVPLCLRILKFGQEMSKIIVSYILHQILSDPNALLLISSSKEKIGTIIRVLNIVVADLAINFNSRLSRNIVISYQLLLKNSQIRSIASTIPLEKLSVNKPPENSDEAFAALFNELLLIHRN